MDRAGPGDRPAGIWIGALLAAAVVSAVLWPPFRSTALTGVHALVRAAWRPAAETPPTRSPIEKLATQSRSMEFRVREFPVDPDLVRAWCDEWRCDATQKQILLMMLLRQLPQAASSEGPAAQRQSQIQAILNLSAEGRQAQPDNAFFRIADALAFFYSNSGQDPVPSSAQLALKDAMQTPRIGAGLRELNASEHALWGSERRPWTLLPVGHRNWGLGLEQALHMMSRGLSWKERELLQKYNIERAVELTLLHLGLAARLAEAGWTPADQAIARAMALRAMDPYSARNGFEPTPAQVESNFLGFLDDQGDRLSLSKANAWLAAISAQDTVMERRMILGRRAQALSAWNASAVLASLLLQTASLALGWVVIAWSVRRASAPPPSEAGARRNVAGLAFAIAPLFWAVTGWPAGAKHLLAGLALGWALWWGLMKLGHERVSLAAARSSLAHTLLSFSVATLLVTAAAAAALQFRQEQFQWMVNQGWLR